MSATLDRVTITGADNSIHPRDLVRLSERFPFVEWGILLSRSQEGNKRFPSLEWIDRAIDQDFGRRAPAFSGHLCGSWVRDICRGGAAFLIERPTIADRFDRFQINFHGEPIEAPVEMVIAGLRNLRPAEAGGIILQADAVNDNLLPLAHAAGIGVAPLFDLSHGAGILPESWPTRRWTYRGYAGGLSPENVAGQLPLILVAAGDGPIWIDVETRVRSNNDEQFDLDKVARFLEAAESFVTRERQR